MSADVRRQEDTRHPCFYAASRKRYGRIHLPVAASCNIQCVYCRRDHDCPHENRPGVSRGVLSPVAAMDYLDRVLKVMPEISVVGIAGPGDPFSAPTATLETLTRVRAAHPDMAMCVSTNGLDLLPHIDALEALGVGFVTVTANAVHPAIAARLSPSILFEGRRLHGAAAGETLVARQLAAVAQLKARGFTVKVNCVVLPGVNEHHVPSVAERMAQLGVDIMNVLPLLPVAGTAMADTPPPSPGLMKKIREQAARHVPQMQHCTRCRADAAGLLGSAVSETPQPEPPQRSCGGDGLGCA